MGSAISGGGDYKGEPLAQLPTKQKINPAAVAPARTESKASDLDVTKNLGVDLGKSKQVYGMI